MIDTRNTQKVELRFNARFACRVVLASRDSNIKSDDIISIIKELNYLHLDNEIASRLRNRLQIEDIDIDAKIRFYEGSIEWDGVLYIVNWMAVTGGTIGLVDYLRKIIMSVINSTIKNNLPVSGWQEPQTTV